jgi:hypothetical protein
LHLDAQGLLRHARSPGKALVEVETMGLFSNLEITVYE